MSMCLCKACLPVQFQGLILEEIATIRQEATTLLLCRQTCYGGYFKNVSCIVMLCYQNQHYWSVLRIYYPYMESYFLLFHATSRWIVVPRCVPSSVSLSSTNSGRQRPLLGGGWTLCDFMLVGWFSSHLLGSRTRGTTQATRMMGVMNDKGWAWVSHWCARCYTACVLAGWLAGWLCVACG
jgi:hypothetical protein